MVCLLSSRLESLDVVERKNSTGDTVFRYHLGVSTPICSSVGNILKIHQELLLISSTVPLN
jgi:hypothetical protein